MKSKDKKHLAGNEDIQQEKNQILGGNPPDPANDIADNEPDKISKIRDILFGNNMSEYDQRFNQLEQKLNKDIEEVIKDNKQKFSSLEDFIKNEFNSLSERLNTINSERKKEMSDHSDKFDGFEELVNNTHSEIRTSIHDRYNELSEVLNSQVLEIKKELESSTAGLQYAKTDRSALAMLLADMAMKLTGENEDNK